MGLGDENQPQSTVGQQQSPPQPYNGQPQYGYDLYQQPQQPQMYGQPQQQQPQMYGQPQQQQQQQPYGQPQYNSMNPQQYQSPIYNATLPPMGYVDPMGGYQSQDAPLLGAVPIAMPPQHYVYHEECQKFPVGPKYQDALYIVLFAAHLLALAILWFVSLGRHVDYTQDTYYVDYGNAALVTFTSVVFSALYIYGFMKIARTHARGLILSTFVANIVIAFICMIVAFALGNVFFGIMLLFVAVVTSIFFLVWRKRIDFTAALLTSTIELIERFPAALRVGFFSMGVNFLWLLFWAAVCSRVLQVFSDGALYFFMIFVVFSFYWVANVIKNVVHTTVSGLYASWYFLDQSVGMPPNPTMQSFKRAMTTSFGSICFGSLLIAIVSTLRFLADSMMNNKNGIVKLIGCILGCILSMMEGILRFFNVYAFTQVAIYGKSYCESAKSTFELFKNRGADLIVNDNFIGTALSMTALLGGILGGVIGVIASQIGTNSASVGGTMAFFMSFTFVLVACEIIYSGVVTVFVCFMMEPAILAQTKPEIYNLYTTTYNKLIL
eukprot:gene11478-13381_t